MEHKAEIWYLLHSGFAIKTKKHFLIFDYYAGDGSFTGSFSEGMIQPEELKDENVVVFASHFHPDHYDKRILEWRKQIPSIRYILSDDIKYAKKTNDKDVTAVHFGQEYFFEDIKVTTYHSTDEGVAFLVETDGLTIYHAGDLNWWHWNGESEQYNASMAGEYRHEIDYLKGKKIDLAFVPVDLRLEDKFNLGLSYLWKCTKPVMIFPMH